MSWVEAAATNVRAIEIRQGRADERERIVKFVVKNADGTFHPVFARGSKPPHKGAADAARARPQSPRDHNVCAASHAAVQNHLSPTVHGGDNVRQSRDRRRNPIKLTPAIFIVFFLLARRTRAAVVAAATFAGCGLVGYLVAPHASTLYWEHLSHDTRRVGAPYVQMPATPEKVWRALEAVKGRRAAE